MDKERVKNVVKLMTLAEKVELTNVNSDLRTSPLPRLKVPSLRLPKEFSAQASYKAPLAGALGHTFDVSLVRAFAEKRSRQALTDGETFGGAVPLGVARDPFDRSACRAFSDDPFVASALAAGFADGLRLSGIGCDVLGVGGSRRFIGARALNEVYLKPFLDNRERLGGVAVPSGELDGVPIGENRGFMKKLTEDFDGVVFSEYGASVDKAEEVSCGVCLGLGCFESDCSRLENAVANGLLYERKLNACVERTVYAAAVGYETVKGLSSADEREIDETELMRLLCEKSATLLKNDGVLPIKETDCIAEYGENLFTEKAVKTDAKTLLKKAEKVARAAAGKDKAIIFLRNADGFDSAALGALIEKLRERAEVAVAVSANAYFEMPWLDKANAVVYLPCDCAQSKSALKKLLKGEIDFSGRLACCWAKTRADYPFAPFDGRSFYVGESVYGASRYFNKNAAELLFDRGFGLAYDDTNVKDFSVKEKSGGLIFEFEAKSAGGKTRSTTVVMDCALDGDALGIGGRAVAFGVIELGAEYKKYTLHSLNGAFDVYDRESGGFKRIGGRYEFFLHVDGKTFAAERKVKGEKAGKIAPYFVIGNGKVIFDETEAEKEIGAPIGGTDKTSDSKAVRNAEKTIAKKSRSNVGGCGVCGGAAGRMSDFAKIKTERYLKGE